MWNFGIENVVSLITSQGVKCKQGLTTHYLFMLHNLKKKSFVAKKKNVLLDAFSYFMPYPNVDYVITLYLVYSLYLQN